MDCSISLTASVDQRSLARCYTAPRSPRHLVASPLLVHASLLCVETLQPPATTSPTLGFEFRGAFVAMELASRTYGVIYFNQMLALGTHITTLRGKCLQLGSRIPSDSCWRAIRFRSRRNRIHWDQSSCKRPLENRGTTAGAYENPLVQRTSARLLCSQPYGLSNSSDPMPCRF